MKFLLLPLVGGSFEILNWFQVIRVEKFLHDQARFHLIGGGVLETKLTFDQAIDGLRNAGMLAEFEE